eukprot:SAG11_NODE_1660_length_4498_cov_5.293021_4_plen_73_part_00
MLPLAVVEQLHLVSRRYAASSSSGRPRASVAGAVSVLLCRTGAGGAVHFGRAGKKRPQYGSQVASRSAEYPL